MNSSLKTKIEDSVYFIAVFVAVVTIIGQILGIVLCIK